MTPAQPGTWMRRRSIAAGAMAAALLCTVPARADVQAGPEIDLPFLAASDFPSLAMLADGSFAVSGCSPFAVQTYSREGVPIGKPLVVPATYGGIGSLGHRYFVSWQHLAPTFTKATFLSRDGEMLARPFTWPNSEIENFFLYYRFGGGPDNAFVPVLYHQQGVDRLDNPIWVPSLQEFGQNAMPTGHLAWLAKFHADWQIFIDDVAVNGEGRIAVISDQCPANAALPQQCARGFQIFGPSGGSDTPLLTRGILQPVLSDGSASGEAALGLDPQGNALVLWAIGMNSPFTFVAQLYDRQGSPISGLVTVAPAPGTASSFLKKVLPLGNNRFALVWLVIDADGTTTIRVSDFQTAAVFTGPVPIGGVVLPGVTIGQAAPEDLLFAVNNAEHGIVAWRTIDESGIFHGHAKLVIFDNGTADRQDDTGTH